MSVGRNLETSRGMGGGLMNTWKTDEKKVKLFLCLSSLLVPLCSHNPAIPIVQSFALTSGFDSFIVSLDLLFI